MNKSRKIELLYKKAKGQSYDASPEEKTELRKYKIAKDEGSFYTTKDNIRDYISAVDHGCQISFYDWCMNNHRADRRRKYSSENEMRKSEQESKYAVGFIGWFTWGVAIYWLFHGSISVMICGLAGAVVSGILHKMARRWVVFTLVLLPATLAVIAFQR